MIVVMAASSRVAILLLILHVCFYVVFADTLKEMVLTHVNYYRAKSAANPVVWDDTAQAKSELDALNCSLQYDVSCSLRNDQNIVDEK